MGATCKARQRQAPALDGVKGGAGLVSVQSPVRVLGQQALDDHAQRAGALQWCRRVLCHGGKRGQQVRAVR
jgi:hypothetical protein